MRATLLCLALALSITARPQGWFPIGATWTYGYTDMFLGQTGYVKHTVTNDSLVEGRICRVLECTRTYEYNGNVLTTGFYPFHYCVYDSGGGVFINVPSQGFDTLYVMDAVPGDRWSLVPFPADCDSTA